MSKAIAAVTALLSGMAVLLVGNGLLMILLPIRAELEGFDTRTIGLLGSSYFLGFFVGCYFVPGIIRRIGQIRAFAAFASLASALTLLHGLFIDPLFWIVVRVITGFAFAGLYMAIESWLHARAPNEMRGSVFSLYMVINLSALALGQQF